MKVNVIKSVNGIAHKEACRAHITSATCWSALENDPSSQRKQDEYDAVSIGAWQLTKDLGWETPDLGRSANAGKVHMQFAVRHMNAAKKEG